MYKSRISVFANIIILILLIFLNNNILSAQQKSQIQEVLNIGSRLELFVDDYIIKQLKEGAELRLHHPTPQGVAILHDAPWEGNNCHFHSIFKDENLYRMYYRGSQIGTGYHQQTYCYAESEDGILWKKPKLGLFDFNGSKENNIILGFDCHSATMFKDNNPLTTREARYKSLVVSFSPKKRGLLAFKSEDGIHWLPMSNKLVITKGAFDSQNVVFWDCVNNEYRVYWRGGNKGVRAIRTATSQNFLDWSEPIDLIYKDSPPEHLYTNQIMPYYRAPHIFIGFPTRYIDRGWSESMRNLPEREHREIRAISSERHGTAITEGLFMVSRDGVNFKRWNEAFLRPGIEREGTWNYGQQYIGWGVVETKSSLEGAPNELSIYATENGWTGTSRNLRRFTLRIDGFVSVNAPMSGGELITKNLTFDGSKLILNFSTSVAGEIRVEIQDETGSPIPGYSLEDCPPIFGDSIGKEVYWNKGSDVSSLKGKPIRLRFVIRDADLFSFQFK